MASPSTANSGGYPTPWSVHVCFCQTGFPKARFKKAEIKWQLNSHSAYTLNKYVMKSFNPQKYFKFYAYCHQNAKLTEVQ